MPKESIETIDQPVSLPIYETISSRIVMAGCNNGCRHCSMSAPVSHNPDDHPLLSFDEIKEIFEQLCKANDDSPPLFNRLNVLFAYDPMLHPDIAEIYQLIASFPYSSDFHKTMATNGSGIASAENYRDMLGKMRDAGLKTIQLSPYGLENTHDWFACRNGAFQEMMSAARRSIEMDLMVNWQYFFHKRSADELHELVTHGREITKDGEAEESIAIIAPAGRGREIEHLRPDSHDLQKLPEELRKIEFLPDYPSEAEWTEEAANGCMEDLLREFYGKLRERNHPELFLPFSKQNMDKISEIINEARHRAAPKRIGEDLSEPDLKWLARRYGDKENKSLYKASMMRNKWLKSHQEETT